MTTVLVDHHIGDAPGASPAESRRPSRRSPGLTVIVAPADTLPAAGALLAKGPALSLVLVPSMPVGVDPLLGGTPLLAYDHEGMAAHHRSAAWRGLCATTQAGFSIHAVETLRADELKPRLELLAGEDVSCLVVSTTSAGRARRLARWIQAPVLALPGGMAAIRGPVVVDARSAARTLPAAARCLADPRAVLVAGCDVVDAGLLSRTSGLSGAVAARQEQAERRRRQALDEAVAAVERAALIAEEHGLDPEPVVVPAPEAANLAAHAPDGIVVVADDHRWIAPAPLTRALRDRRPVLVVPAP